MEVANKWQSYFFLICFESCKYTVGIRQEIGSGKSLFTPVKQF